jgi:hypothetical protein
VNKWFVLVVLVFYNWTQRFAYTQAGRIAPLGVYALLNEAASGKKPEDTKSCTFGMISIVKSKYNSHEKKAR